MIHSKTELRKQRNRKRYGRNMKITGVMEAGWSAKRVSREFGLSYSWAKKLVRKLKAGASPERAVGSGPHRKTSSRQDRIIIREAKKEPEEDEDCPRASDLAEKLQNRGIHVSARTVRRRLREVGLKKRVKTRKPFVSRVNRRKRVKWARAHLNWTIEDWKKVLFTDESPYVLRCQLRQYVWRTVNEKYHARCFQGTVKHQKKINVWGGFSWSGVGHIHRIIGNMDRFMYRQILIHHMRPSGRQLIGDDFIFQQDNDPKHTSIVCRNYLRNQNIRVLPWPPQSPDLNPIENLWSELDRKMRKRKCNTEEELFEQVKTHWNQLDSEYLQKLVESMPRRCAEVIRKNGYPIDY